MKKKKVPILREIITKSFFVIIIILAIYTFGQIITFWIFTDEYEKDLLKDRYREIVSLSNNISTEISEEGFRDHLKTLNSGEVDEEIRIYSKDKVYYQSKSDIWEDINYRYIDNDIKIETKILDFDIYMIISADIKISDSNYIIQVVRENDIFKEFTENSLPIFIITLVLGLILSGVGAIYVSKSFVDRLKKLTKTMNEIKENGIDKRAEISEANDEIDKVNIVFNSMMDEVQDAFEEQSRFVSDASHELKTPLTALQGHLSMLKRWGKNDKVRLEKSLDICLNEVERLKKIVNDMLILSKAENENIDLNELDKINPKDIINELIYEYRILNDKVKYIVNIEDNIKIKVKADDLKQLLIIFIDNSIKYNNKESIEIKITLLKEEEQIKLEVKDNGIGIPKDEINNVMKRFYKVDKSRVNNNSFGIGLSIANRIVNKYKAKIKIDSELNRYTTISVYFNL
ncbi:HAMP domain-containing histidine kinase [Clostridium sp. Sa3CUN1]|uniref:histidine kinase n=1 Tax=Clostridium gallinarum TaxID=2762246 RepID=A0ABR8Q6Y1_9CLOT|nr:HAMP domain-containing sensor histidine kinase [Clostridium gallinarum]MBD7916187.1 HAMP domain-containing histidine kinase [Clostridium gallinarum]